jgi:hypothetical protein
MIRLKTSEETLRTVVATKDQSIILFSLQVNWVQEGGKPCFLCPRPLTFLECQDWCQPNCVDVSTKGTYKSRSCGYGELSAWSKPAAPCPRPWVDLLALPMGCQLTNHNVSRLPTSMSITTRVPASIRYITVLRAGASTFLAVPIE